MTFKMRTGAVRFGGSSYYRLIGSVHVGAPVEVGDAILAFGNATRDRLLRQYAGRPIKTAFGDEHERKDQTPEP